MAYQQHFSENIVRLFNEVNHENTRFQLQLAQKQDELATLHAQLHHSGAGGVPLSGPHLQPHFQALQQQVHDLQTQLRQAQERAATAESCLNKSRSRFTDIYHTQRESIDSLEKEVKELKQRSPPTQDAGKNEEELQKLRAELAASQRPFEAKKEAESCRGGRPTTALEKAGPASEEDQTDEEMMSGPYIKQELDTGNDLVALPSLTRAVLSPTGLNACSQPTRRSIESGRLEDLSSVRSDSPVRAPSVDCRSSPDDHSKPIIQKTGVDIDRPKSRKRRQSEKVASEEASGVRDEMVEKSEVEQPLIARKRTRLSTPPRSELLSNFKKRFEFKAIIEYSPSGGFDALISETDLQDEEIPNLWDHVQKVHEEWKEAKGENWKDEFRVGKECKRACVSEKLQGRRSVWRTGAEGQMFACNKCVGEKRPCFVWSGHDFRLLPLHDEDCKKPVEEDHEIRYWLRV